jgi:hypothetical protein
VRLDQGQGINLHQSNWSRPTTTYSKTHERQATRASKARVGMDARVREWIYQGRDLG